MKPLFSLGTSNRSFEEFLNILKKFAIQRVIDIRRFPTSRFPHFKKDILENLLKKENIEYVYLGELLGGYRRQGYIAFMETEEFKKGLERLKKLAKEKRSVIICCERFYFKCHRRFVASKLEKDFEIIHLQ